MFQNLYREIFTSKNGIDFYCLALIFFEAIFHGSFFFTETQYLYDETYEIFIHILS